MPGSSLWLLPPSADNPFNKSMQELISSTIPSDFAKTKVPKFTPHVTLTSDIDPSKTYSSSSSSAQSWLDAIALPTAFKKEHNEVPIELEELEPGEAYFKKLTLRAAKPANLLLLAAAARAAAVPGTSESDAKAWAEGEFAPHLSLMYADLPVAEVKKKISLIELQLGWEFGSLFDCCGGQLAQGARLVLVDTSKEVGEWEVLAERVLPWVVWRMARGLI